MSGSDAMGISTTSEPEQAHPAQDEAAVSSLSHSSGEDLRIERISSVLTITLTQHATRNAFGLNQARALLNLLEELFHNDVRYEDKRVGALVFRSGVEGVFASGGDLNEIRSRPSQAAQSMDLMRAACRLLSTLPALSVALLSGAAVGGGAELALACDERWIVTAAARLDLRQRAWGLPFGWNGLRRLNALRPQGGIRKAALDFVEGKTWSADELLVQNLADVDARGWSDSQLNTALNGRACRVLECPAPLARALLHETVARDDDQMTADAELFARFWKGPLHEEALARTAEKTKNPIEGPL